MKMVGASGADGQGVDTSGRGRVGTCCCQRCRNSATNAEGSISRCWTVVFRQYVSKKSDSDGSWEDKQPAKKNWMRSRESAVSLTNACSHSSRSSSWIAYWGVEAA